MSKNYRINDQTGIHFLTAATVGWIDVFTRRRYRDIFVDSLNYCVEKKGFLVYAWVLMPSHFHLVARAENSNLSDIVRNLKKFTSRKIVESIASEPESRREWMLAIMRKEGEHNSNNKNWQFWRQDNHPIQLESNMFIEQKIDYVHNNPVNDGFVEEPQDWLYSSARDYAGLKGFVDIEHAW